MSHCGTACNDNFSDNVPVLRCDICERTASMTRFEDRLLLPDGWRRDGQEHMCGDCDCQKCGCPHATSEACYVPDLGDL